MKAYELWSELIGGDKTTGREVEKPVHFKGSYLSIEYSQFKMNTKSTILFLSVCRSCFLTFEDNYHFNV